MSAFLSDADYRAAVERINEIIDAARGTPEGAEFERLAVLIEEYEEIHYPFPPKIECKAVVKPTSEGRAKGRKRGVGVE